VGNESWACGGHMRAEYYADLYRRYATFCRNYGDNKLYKIACGPGNALATPEEDYHWTEVLMREAGRYMDGLSLHYYTIAGPGWKEKGSATDFAEDAWFSALYKARHMDELIRRHGAIMDRYDPEKRVGLIVDEWGTWHDVEPGTHPGFLYMQNSLRDALVAAITLNIFNQHSERVRMANIAQTVNVLQAMVLTEGEKMLLTPTYHVFDLYKVHHDATMLPLHIECERYAGADADMPVIHASASLDAEKKIHLSLCNVHASESKELRCQLRGVEPAAVTGQVLTGPAINAHNTFEQPDLVRPVEFAAYSLRGDVLTIEMPARALVALELR
jgi:alpha-L-arabinofuranosidase